MLVAFVLGLWLLAGFLLVVTRVGTVQYLYGHAV